MLPCHGVDLRARGEERRGALKPVRAHSEEEGRVPGAVARLEIRACFQQRREQPQHLGAGRGRDVQGRAPGRIVRVFSLSYYPWVNRYCYPKRSHTTRPTHGR